jgi:O-antigen/teichoic acid export membrane protein
MGFLKKEKSDIKAIWRRILKRDFSGTTGLIIKNSFYQFSRDLTTKLSSFIFTVILARLLLPEMFGLYSLAFSTILIFAAISELGVRTTLIRFIAKEFGKKRGKIKAHLLYLGRIGVVLVFCFAILLLILADYISNNFYQKPIFLALLAGSLYIIFIQLTGFLQSMLQASNHFAPIFKREIIFQTSRIILIPLAVILAIKYSLSSGIILMLIILLLVFSLFLTSLFLFFDVKKIYLKKIKTEKTDKLQKKQKTIINKFLLATAALVLSGVFFLYIDKVMLGHFVQAEFIGYYTAASSLIGALTPLIGFAAVVVLPIFSRLKGERLEQGFRKSIRITILFSAGAFLATLILAYFVILIVYGKEYISALNILRILSLLLFIIPAASLYQAYYISQGKPQIVAQLLVIATILNVLLNYIFITLLLPYGNLAAVYGVAIATIISQFFYLGVLAWRRNNFKKH